MAGPSRIPALVGAQWGELSGEVGMLCAECGRENPPGSKFCGFCGHQASVSLATASALATAPAAKAWSPHSGPQPEVSQQPIPAGISAPQDRARSVDGSDQATTRYLCAAVSLDPALEHR